MKEIGEENVVTDRELWNIFVQKQNIKETEYEAWAFGGAPDKLAGLVTEGIKTATASAYPLYEFTKDRCRRKAGTA